MRIGQLIAKSLIRFLNLIGDQMLDIWERMTVVTLAKLGKSISEISKIVGFDRKTVRKMIKSYNETGKEEVIKKAKQSGLDQHKDKINAYLEKGLSCVRIYEELKANGIDTKYSTLTYFVTKLKEKEDMCIRFHTSPGQEAQVDFGYIGLQPDQKEKRRKAYAFCMTLSYSRLGYVRIVFDQKMRTFAECHIEAFKYFGGVPETVRIDNLKSAITNADFYEPTYNNLYKLLADHYGFGIIACRVREPQEKGKIEAGVKYVKNNFCAGRNFKNNSEMESVLKFWLDKTCNSRKHGTHKKVPRELFESEEKSSLKQLPITDFIFPDVLRRTVCKDCHVVVNQSYYSVPSELVGKIVDVNLDGKLVKISHAGKEVAVHVESKEIGKFITNRSHYPQYKDFDPGSDKYRATYSDKMNAIGPNAGKMFYLVLEQQPTSWYRIVSGIISLQKAYSDEVVDAACKRALEFNITSFIMIKNICKTGSYKLSQEE